MVFQVYKKKMFCIVQSIDSLLTTTRIYLTLFFLYKFTSIDAHETESICVLRSGYRIRHYSSPVSLSLIHKNNTIMKIEYC